MADGALAMKEEPKVEVKGEVKGEVKEAWQTWQYFLFVIHAVFFQNSWLKPNADYT